MILLIKDDISDDYNNETADKVELLSSSEIDQKVQLIKFPDKAKKCIKFKMGKEFGNYKRLQ